MTAPRLTSLSPAGGCGCKFPPSGLDSLLEGIRRPSHSFLQRGPEGHSDASVFPTEKGTSFLSVDFFTPVVDEASDWGRIAAQNALSDIWAAGGRPHTALCIAAWPEDRDVHELQTAILGAQEVFDRDGVELGGGHTIIDSVPKLGFCVYGSLPSDRLPPGNRGARHGDRIILTKRLGTGVAMTAHKLDRLAARDYQEVIASMISSNGPAAELLRPTVSAMTDITGYGLLGHLSEMLNNSRIGAVLDASSLPAFSCVAELFRFGMRTTGGERVWKHYGSVVQGAQDPYVRLLLTDPQTSGGLLACVPEVETGRILAQLSGVGVDAITIGRVVEGPPTIVIQ